MSKFLFFFSGKGADAVAERQGQEREANRRPLLHGLDVGIEQAEMVQSRPTQNSWDRSTKTSPPPLKLN